MSFPDLAPLVEEPDSDDTSTEPSSPGLWRTITARTSCAQRLLHHAHLTRSRSPSALSALLLSTTSQLNEARTTSGQEITRLETKLHTRADLALCPSCHVGKRTRALIPCGHMICSDCVLFCLHKSRNGMPQRHYAGDKTCTICRSKIDSSLKIYV